MQIEQFQRFSSFCHSDGRRTTSKDNLVFCSNYLTDRTKRINLIRVIQGSCYIHASGKKKVWSVCAIFVSFLAFNEDRNESKRAR